MRSQVHGVTVNFRVNQGLLARAQLRAERKGMSLSELFRHALREETEKGN